MEFTDYPQPIPLSLYQEAIQAYTCLVAKRVHAVYHTGTIRTPGISDLDLIVVPRGPRLDNYQYFAPRRLHRPLQAVFRHPPFVLPLEAHGILRYTTHTRIKLLSGRDVLPTELYEESLEDRWAMLFEDYCRYYDFLWGAAERGSVSVRFLLSKVYSINIPLQTLACITGLGSDAVQANYQQADALRMEWFENRCAPQERAQRAWTLLQESFNLLTVQLGELVAVTGAEALHRLALAFLRSEVQIAGLDPRALEVRRQVFRQYLEQFFQLGFLGGSLVSEFMFGDDEFSVRRGPLSLAVRRAFGLAYKTERLMGALHRR